MFNNTLINIVVINKNKLVRFNWFLVFVIGLRLGTSQLCADHIKHLFKVSVILVERHDSIEAIMLDYMIISLFELLNEDMKFSLLRNLIENLDTNNYGPIVYLLVGKTKGFLTKQLCHKLGDLSKAFLDLQEHPSIHNWKRLVRFINLLYYKKWINFLTNLKLWSQY